MEVKSCRSSRDDMVNPCQSVKPQDGQGASSATATAFGKDESNNQMPTQILCYIVSLFGVSPMVFVSTDEKISVVRFLRESTDVEY